MFVSEVLQDEKPSFFVCNSDNLYQDQDIPSLDSEDELDARQIYFILPKSMLARRLRSSDMASLAVKASLALDSSSNSNSHVKKIKNNNARISPMVLMETSQINVIVEEEENKQNYKNGGFGISSFSVSLCCCFYAMRRNESEGRPSQYGKVIDAFIPARVSKEGKKIAFVRFIKGQKQHVRVSVSVASSFSRSFAAAVSNKERSHSVEKNTEDKSVMIIDDDCLIEKNFKITLVAKVKVFDSMPNLRIIFNDEGFKNLTNRYLGGLWDSIEFLDAHDGLQNLLKRILKPSSDSGDEKNEESTPYTDICSGVQGKGGNESDINRDFENKTNDSIKEESDNPFGLYNLLNQRDKCKKDKPMVSDNLSKPPGFSKIIVEDNTVSGKEKGQVHLLKKPFTQKQSQVNSHEPILEMSFKPMQETSVMEKEQQSEGILNSESIVLKMFLKRMLYNYLHGVLNRWHREIIMIGDFNEVRFHSERHGSDLNKQGATLFNSFIDTSSLIEVSLGGYSITWAVRDATKMSKLDRFLVSDGLLCQFLALSESWHIDVVVESNEMLYLKKKFQILKKKIKIWVQQNRVNSNDKRTKILEKLQEKYLIQKAKMKWAIECDENSKYFHVVLNQDQQALIEEEVSDVEIKRASYAHRLDLLTLSCKHDIVILDFRLELVLLSLSWYEHMAMNLDSSGISCCNRQEYLHV
nr:hypothetical protein [Tanacetum cinerariifolium]